MRPSAVTASVFLLLASTIGASAFARCIAESVPTQNVGFGDNALNGVSGTSIDDVWAVGWRQRGPIDQTLIEHFNGLTWSVVPSPNDDNHPDDQLLAVGVFSPSDAWAVGARRTHCGGCGNTMALVARWNGSAWTQIDVPRFSFGPGNYPGQYLVGVSVNPVNENDVWMVGNIPSHGIRGEPSFIYAEHWNGLQWSIYGLPSGRYPAINGVSTSPDGEAWAVGAGLGTGTTQAILHWNGSAWSQQASARQDDHDFFGVAAISADDAWVVGRRVEHFDGRSWQVSQPGFGIAISARDSTDVWRAVGTNDLHWNGKRWATVDQPNVAANFYGIQAFSNGAITVGTTFSHPSKTASILTICSTR